MGPPLPGDDVETDDPMRAQGGTGRRRAPCVVDVVGMIGAGAGQPDHRLGLVQAAQGAFDQIGAQAGVVAIILGDLEEMAQREADVHGGRQVAFAPRGVDESAYGVGQLVVAHPMVHPVSLRVLTGQRRPESTSSPVPWGECALDRELPILEYMPALTPPSPSCRNQALKRLSELATPPGALGRLGELGVWLAACQGQVPPVPVDGVRLVIFAGDHGVAAHGVSAFPSAITGAMVRTFLAGKAGVSALAEANHVSVRVLDIGVDEDFADLDEPTRAALTAYKIRRGSGAIHLEDALTREEAERALEAGAAIAREEIAAGAQLLLSGDMGIGNTTPAAAMIAAALGLPASEVVGRGTGIDDDGLRRKAEVITAALARVGERTNDSIEMLAALGSADLAATTGYLLAAARAGVPVLLDGLMSVACAITAECIEPGAAAWFAAGHRSTEPAQSVALAKMGLEPLLDLGLRLGEGSGAVAAVPLVRSASALLRDVALLSELGI